VVRAVRPHHTLRARLGIAVRKSPLLHKLFSCLALRASPKRVRRMAWGDRMLQLLSLTLLLLLATEWAAEQSQYYAEQN
jgi:hypothetical protein